MYPNPEGARTPAEPGRYASRVNPKYINNIRRQTRPLVLGV